jgi:hypothetical protein
VTRGIAVLMFLAGLLMPSASAAERPSRWRAVWRMSQVLLAGAESADIASSWGKNEGNPLVRTGSRFSYGSLAIKLGVLTGGITAQHFIVRKSPDQARLYAAGNLAATAVLSVVAVHNMHVPAPH